MSDNLSKKNQYFNYSAAEYLGRALWLLAAGLFRCSPKFCFVFRRMLLRIFGARIGKGTKIYPSVRIALPWNLEIGAKTCVGEKVNLYNLGKIQIGNSVTISQGAYLCGGTHDYTATVNAECMPLIKGGIKISDGGWICADAFIGPKINIGAFSIVAARAVVTKDIGSEIIVGGNPAKFIKKRISD